MDYLYSLQCFREKAPDIINIIFVIISEAVVYVGPLFPVVIYLCVDKNKGALYGFNLIITDTINNLLKITACVYRPWVRDSRIIPAKEISTTSSGYSFPSGHTAAATAVYGSAIMWKKNNKILVIIMVAMIALTGFARNYLGCHTLLDVCASVIETILIMYIISLVAKVIEKNPNYDLWIFIGLIIFSIVATIFALMKSYPMDYDAQGNLLVEPILMQKDTFGSLGMLVAWAISWFCERRFINFSIEGTTKEKVIRATIAAVIFALLYLVIMKFLVQGLDIRLGAFLKRFVSVLAVAGIYPFVLKKLQDKRRN